MHYIPVHLCRSASTHFHDSSPPPDDKMLEFSDGDMLVVLKENTDGTFTAYNRRKIGTVATPISAPSTASRRYLCLLLLRANQHLRSCQAGRFRGAGTAGEYHRVLKSDPLQSVRQSSNCVLTVTGERGVLLIASSSSCPLRW